VRSRMLGIQALFRCEGRDQGDFGLLGRSANAAEYETVSTGATGHAESVKLVYDPSQVTYGRVAARILLGGARFRRS